MRALTREIADPKSPVRRFLDERFPDVRPVQRGYREGAPPLLVEGNAANPATVGTAADWLLRFLLHPAPDVHLAMAGAARYIGPAMMRAVADLASTLGTKSRPYTGGIATGGLPYELVTATVQDLIAPIQLGEPNPTPTFAGPTTGSATDPALLARGCWALALLTDVFRSGAAGLLAGPLAPFYRAGTSPAEQPAVTARDLLALAPTAGLDQLDRLREVLENTLLPRLAERPGGWAIGPTFAGSRLVGGADADMIAAGLLLDLKVTLGDKRPDGTRRLSLDKAEVYQLVGYALLDFDDTYRINEVSIFSARYAYLATWPLGALLVELAGHPMDLVETRTQFEHLLHDLREQELAARTAVR